ncbi:MAG: pyrroline-5-carboxylate reductase [Desulfobacterales bacterium]|nr:pyrroline-5-carboxylate reductase [Desulfobacterales bacterium]
MQTGFIGAGNMAQAIIGGLIRTGTPAEKISIFEPDTELAGKLASSLGVQAESNNTAIFENCDVIVLAVKPQIMKAALESAKGARLKKDAFIVSVAAGMPISLMQGWLGNNHPMVRAMPNTPALVGAGVSGLFSSKQVSIEQKQAAESILRAVGSVIWVDREDLIDSVTAVSGSGPAYFFYFIEALQHAALQEGLSLEHARLLSLETAFGAAKLALESSVEASTLRERVTSPGGTTAAALEVFEKQGVSDSIARAVSAAATRARELGKH